MHLGVGKGIPVLLAYEIVHSFGCAHKITEGLYDCICWCDFWLHDVCVFEVNGVQEAKCACRLDKNVVCAIVFG